jgi:ATP-dependent RNA helicase DeaD
MLNLSKFRDLGLSESMIESLRQKGFEEPTPIQAKTIPHIIKNEKDLIGKAQTGTGKTAAFGIPLIENIVPDAGKVQAIILAPTRELAIQVSEELNSFCGKNKTKIVAIYGGQSIERQIQRLKRGVDIVVGTPGRVLDHLKRRTMSISEVSYIVLDEADEMLNMGFIDDIETILKLAPKKKRMILFSATMPSHIQSLAKRYMGEYELIETKTDQITKDNIQQIYFEVSQDDKFEALFRIIDIEDSFYGLVFCRTKVDADDIAHKLTNRGCRSESLHGDLSQGQREKILQQFRNKKITVLVATDVAARGIDIDDLTHVINYSIPQDPESYVHRIGRTGRAGKTGIAITLVTPSEYRKLTTIERVANTRITKQKIPNIKKVIDAKKQKIAKIISDFISSPENLDLPLVDEILNSINIDAVEGEDSDTKLKQVIAALLKNYSNDEFNEGNYNEIQDGGFRRKPRGEGFGRDRDNGRDGNSRGGYNNRMENDRGGRVDSKGTARLFIAKGRNDGMDPRKLVDFIQKETNIDQSKIDDVKIFDAFSFFAAPFADAEEILKTFQQNASGNRSLVSRAKSKERKPY